MNAHEQREELNRREARIADAIIVKAEELKAIYDGDLYKVTGQDWETYLRQRWDMAPSTYRSLRASAKRAQQILDEFGVTLGNLSAMREVRKLYSKDSPIVARVVHKAQQRAGNGNPVMGKDIKAVVNTLETILATDGLCDDGEGSMTAFDSAVSQEVYEATMRQREYIKANGKGGWSKPLFVFKGRQFTLSALDRQLPEGKRIEIRWRIVEQPASENDPEQRPTAI